MKLDSHTPRNLVQQHNIKKDMVIILMLFLVVGSIENFGKNKVEDVEKVTEILLQEFGLQVTIIFSLISNNQRQLMTLMLLYLARVQIFLDFGLFTGISSWLFKKLNKEESIYVYLNQEEQAFLNYSLLWELVIILSDLKRNLSILHLIYLI